MTTDNFEKVMGPIRADHFICRAESIRYRCPSILTKTLDREATLIRLVDALWKERQGQIPDMDLLNDDNPVFHTVDALLAELVKENEDAMA